MSFKFRTQVIYERLLTFTQDMYILTSKLPDYEQHGLISKIRAKSHEINHVAAVGLSSPKGKEVEEAMKACIHLVSHLVSDIDVANKLGYLDENAHKRALTLAEEITRYLHETKEAQ